ncbi:MAG: DUF1553 domain-containing protein [Planctomycetota bacterium]|nr:MAG: DUF1553 domain-containing protein [Planctomycetota bacterium]REK38453.1 MAG: DUF1553 domain-containing protein [Planctomycetota bacterium]
MRVKDYSSPMNRHLPLVAALFAAALAVWWPLPGHAEEGKVPTDGVDFARDVRPLLAANCFHCHGPDEQEGGLRLDGREAFFTGGVSGPAVEQGASASSHLIARLRSDDEDQRMPPDADPLSAEQVALVARWIDEGAIWPEGVGDRDVAGAEHWAYRRPQPPERPAVRQTSWPRNEIDTFVLARLEREGLEPSPSAEPATLLRRLYLDLIGLPPSVAEVEAFIADPSPAAFEATVDRLLASPRFGEKWARSWLDLARYADSNGYQADQLREMWAYRDWVIAALNDDMPYDQFTIEQIAGDLLPEATLEQRIATGFHRTPTCNIEAGVDPEENRTNQVVDRVNTTATVWLGTTLDCARCHTHKYDPFTQREYYQLFAYFNHTPLEVKQAEARSVQFDFFGPKMELPLTPEKRRKRAKIEAELAEPRAQLKEAEARALESLADWEAALTAGQVQPSKELPADKIKQLQQVLAKPREEQTAYERSRLEDYFLATWEETRELRATIGRLEAELARHAADTTLVMIEMPEPRETHVFKRGEFLQPGDKVTAGVPDVLHALPEDAEPTRLGLARWLIDPANPLAARVRVNHFWTEIFGRGLVATGGDFGTQGSPPSHPELLDWLALTFMDDGWSTKRTIKRLVMSATYQQSSRMTRKLAERDPENELLARGPRFRLPAETIRDAGLAVSGLLSTKMGGPPVYPPQPPKLWRQTGRGEPVYDESQGEDRFRRGVYVVWRRVAPYPSFVNFDAPDRTRCVVNRPRTNTPMQALTLLNDEAYIEMARALAARLLAFEGPLSDAARIDRAFQMCLARQPSVAERSVLEELLAEERDRLAKDAADVTALTHEAALPEGVERPADAAEWAAWLCVANALLNLDETISKE